MVNQQLIEKFVNLENIIVPTLFKPGQFNIFKKINKGKKLTENEKRYLRGKIREKCIALQELISKGFYFDGYSFLLNSIGSYYITGLEALKQNGFGWYFDVKIIEIINTKIDGRIFLNKKIIKFIRVKSIKESKIIMDKENGLKYASNDQIIKDILYTKNNYVKILWEQMYSRYKKMFAKKSKNIKIRISKDELDFSKYGV